MGIADIPKHFPTALEIIFFYINIYYVCIRNTTFHFSFLGSIRIYICIYTLWYIVWITFTQLSPSFSQLFPSLGQQKCQKTREIHGKNRFSRIFPDRPGKLLFWASKTQLCKGQFLATRTKNQLFTYYNFRFCKVNKWYIFQFCHFC